MILECVTIQALGLSERRLKASLISPYGEALVFVKATDVKALGIHWHVNPLVLQLIDRSNPYFGSVTPVWVRVVERCEDGTFLGFQTDLRSRPFGVKLGMKHVVKFYARKTMVAA